MSAAEDFAQIRMQCIDPLQHDYEVIRPIVLFGESAAERSRQTGIDRTVIGDSGAVITQEPLPTVLAHQTSLVQLFQNLLSNAIKYRGEAPPRVHVCAHRTAEGWQFAVQDNGIGIAPQEAQRIFRIFTRLPGQTSAGTGIGLAICQKVVERYGGHIWVESTPKQGSTFYFTFRAV